MEEAKVLFSIFGIDVTGYVTTMWAIMAVLAVLFIMYQRVICNDLFSQGISPSRKSRSLKVRNEQPLATDNATYT
jgi:hypothetical protein